MNREQLTIVVLSVVAGGIFGFLLSDFTDQMNRAEAERCNTSVTRQSLQQQSLKQ